MRECIVYIYGKYLDGITRAIYYCWAKTIGIVRYSKIFRKWFGKFSFLFRRFKQRAFLHVLNERTLGPLNVPQPSRTEVINAVVK